MDENQIRERFERFIGGLKLKHDLRLDERDDGEKVYANHHTQALWFGWRAAHEEHDLPNRRITAIAVGKRPPRPRKVIVHVDQHAVRRNIKAEVREPVLTVKGRGANRRVNEVRMHGTVTFVYRPDKPLSCGARCWAECYGEVEIVDGGGDG